MMSTSTLMITVSLMLLVQQQHIAGEPITLSLVTIAGNGQTGTCPPKEMRDEVLTNITTAVKTILSNGITNPNCGEGLWYRVAHLNVSDLSQNCPVSWRENNTDGIRSCRRPQTSVGSCPGTTYITGQQYSKVCGRAIGYQIGSTDAFSHLAVGNTIDSYYVYGVSVTHGSPRNHIWTFASGLSEGDYAIQRDNCPCSDPGSSDNRYPPSFVGDNYYCESGNPTDTFIIDHIYSSDPLWDGQQCEGECCSNGKSPPWFSVELPNPTTNDIEVRICSAEGSFDDTVVQLLEVYIQ